MSRDVSRGSHASFETPVLLLVFRRPDTTARVFAEIRKARPTRLFIAADGPRAGYPEEAKRCQAVRDIVAEVDWDCEVRTNYRTENLGLKLAVSSAISWFFEQVEEGIILEDDCLPVPSFFTFCETVLARYRDDRRVLHITGNNFQDGRRRGDGSYYFSRLPTIWGWATWRRAWALFDPDTRTFPEFKKQHALRNVFPNEATRAFWMDKIEAARRGNDSWGFPWVYTVLSHSGLCVNPNTNLVSNCGFGEGGAHAVDPRSRLANMPTSDITEIVEPLFMVPDLAADDYFSRAVAAEQAVPKSFSGSLKMLTRSVLGDRYYGAVKAMVKGSRR